MRRKKLGAKRAVATALAGMLCVTGMAPGAGLTAFAATEGVENPFADVAENKWYYSYVNYALESGLMGGKDTTEDGKIVFEPENHITRDQIVMILYNREGRPAVEYVEKFNDIPDGKWYTDAVMWAVEEGITAGKDGGTRFGFNEPITREEMATMLYQYASYKEWDISERADFSGFDDAETISSWAVEYMKWVVAKGVMAGKNNRLAPRDNASRAEAATMFKAFLEAYETETPVDEEYTLVWEDNFEGTALNREDWNVELHEPGWVNNELQQYVDSEENIYVEDGNLVIQAVKKDNGDGTVSYTSGRVNTQNKHDFKYGKFEARLKVPAGQGFLPAFWMMPTDESFYGQWPKCGEIDIMEVLGSEINTSHGTLHFGEPHTQSQGGYTLEEGDFNSEYHVFSCEWEPGEIRFYVDGELFHTENQWFTKKNGYGEVTYPAPYDQPFYMILNLAVGGNWPGNPDETTEFGDNAQLVVDYVKVYQKDSYDENVEKPEIVLEFRDPDETGNYVINGDFAVEEDLTDSTDWFLLLAGGGQGSAAIADGELTISTINAGTLDYSVQFVQPEIPLQLGKQYRLSFDAYADEARTMIANVTAPKYDYVRYLADQSVALTTEKQSYSYDFDMVTRGDVSGRIEFCLGNQGSTATVHISNVRLEAIGEVEIPEEEKSILPDGNYVYNGEFQEGMGRLDYWTIDNNCAGATVEVTNIDGVRELKVSVAESTPQLNEITVSQSEIAITGGKTFVLSFDAYADAEKTIQSTVAGETFEATLSTTKTNYKYKFTTADGLNGSELKFFLGNAGITYIDNVRIQEEGMFINGDFSNGMVGYEPYNGGTSSVSFGVDSLNEADALCADITNTGEADWNIQLKQNNITLENGKWYTISFDAKVKAAGQDDFTRRIMYALQRDGSADDVWTPYSGTQKIDLTGEYQNFSTTFQMQGETDTTTIFSISMGAVDGIQITTPHTVVIDNIVFVETEAPVMDEIPVGTELITNGDFAEGKIGWEASAIDGAASATEDFTQGNVTYTIADAGTADYHVQLKQSGLTLEQGATYEISFRIQSDVSRGITYALLNPNANYDYYGGASVALVAGEEQAVNQTIVVEKATVDTIDFVISLGKEAEVETPASIITIDDISIVKTAAGTGEKPDGEIVSGTELITNGDFADGSNGWVYYVDADNAVGTTDFTGGKAVFDITNQGTEEWHVHMKQTNLTLEQGASYRVQYTITSDAEKTLKCALQHPTSYAWYYGEEYTLEAGETKVVDTVFTVAHDTADVIELMFSMGQVEETTAPFTIEISNVSLVKQ